jgi:NAD(P)-dependent dehydrogenase (short-subunit alcohol dehydrogenase family)
MTTVRYVALTVVVLASAFSRPLLLSVFHMFSHPADPLVGNVLPSSAADLRARLAGKRALVVGGTRGVGGATALALARYGANVTIVGRSPTFDMLERLQTVAQSQQQQQQQHFSAHAFDLAPRAGVSALMKALSAEMLSTGLPAFEVLILSVGAWPNALEPKTADGIDRVIALDLLTRFSLIDGLHKRRMLKPSARVLSVLASTNTPMPVPSAAAIRGSLDTFTYSGLLDLPRLFGMVAICHDALLLKAAKSGLPFTFIGTHPGFVPTDVIAPTFGALSPALKLAFSFAPISITEAQAGENTVQTLTSPNAGRRRVSFFNHELEGREAAPRSYELPLQEWLWQWLERGGSGRQHGQK